MRRYLLALALLCTAAPVAAVEIPRNHTEHFFINAIACPEANQTLRVLGRMTSLPPRPYFINALLPNQYVIMVPKGCVAKVFTAYVLDTMLVREVAKGDRVVRYGIYQVIPMVALYKGQPLIEYIVHEQLLPDRLL